MINIDISPSNKLNSNKIILHPITPSELWLVAIKDGPIIYSILTKTVLSEKEDDQGLYYRLRTGFKLDFTTYVAKLNIQYMLIGCAKHQEEAPACSNILYVYDMYDTMGSVIDTHLTSRCCQFASNFNRPPHLIKSRTRLNEIYEQEDPLLFWGESRFPRPILLRSYNAIEPVYQLRDPYLQWSPPKFWHQEDFLQTIPSDTEGWIHEILQSFNWDYFYHLIIREGRPIADTQHLAASLFDIIYEDYLYYSICKKIWVDQKEVETNPFIGQTNDQVIVNFTDIVNSIQYTLRHKLARLDLSVLKEKKQASDIDLDEFAPMFNQILAKSEREDE